MTIDEAIKILDTELLEYLLGDRPEFVNAVNLGIEALKRIHAGRVAGHILWEDLLPGETGK